MRAARNSVPFIALTETWLKPYVHDAQLEIEHYNISRCDRSTRVGGGVLLYTHEDLPITNVEKHDDKICQLLMCTCESSKMIICLLYRPPDAPYESLKSCLEQVHNYTKDQDDYETCFLGDFNLPSITWSPSSEHASLSESAELLLGFMSEQLSSQYIVIPTRKDNILDLFISNSASLVSHVLASDTGMSDHRLIEIFLSYDPCQPNISTPPAFQDQSFRSLDFNKADYDKISSLLQETDWDALIQQSDPEEFPNIVTQKLLEACQTGCPRKKPPKKRGSTLLRTLSRKKRKLQQKLDRIQQSPHTPQSQLDSINVKLNRVYYDIRDAVHKERQFREEQAVCKVKTNPKYFYSYAKKFSKTKRSISMLFDSDNNICHESALIANILQKQFTSVFSDPSATDLSSGDFDVPPIDHPFTDDKLDFGLEDIIEAIDDIKLNASAGPDGIPPCVLKHCKESLAKPIYLIWSRSLDSSVVPSCYKVSYIAPLHKKGSHAIPANYRPVSLTSHVIKIFERVMRKRLVDHFESNMLLCKNQHGFRAGRSCLTQLLAHFDDILESLMKNADLDSIYLDYAKAFDKVDHALLIKKLERYGVHPKLVSWIESFLTDRMQQVVVDGHMSLLGLIISGVPQGTVLGPILFLVFINDINQCITSSTLRCFADDTRISRTINGENDVNTLQHDLDKVMQWSINNNMMLHEDKFEYMSHSATKSSNLRELPFVEENFQYTTSKGCTLSPVHQLRDLGVTVCDNVSWSPHINSISKKARQKAAWVLSVFYTRSPTVMLTLYKSMVRSLLEFCSPLWNPVKISDIQELEGVQKTFTAKIHGCRDLDYWERLKKLSLMSLQRRRERYSIIHMWKLLHEQTSNDLQIKFHNRSRLGTLAVIPPLSRDSSSRHQSMYDSSFAVHGPKLWNAMPNYLNSISDFPSFKSRLTAFLLSVPDKPPVRGYTTANSNSLLAWRVDSSASALWGGQRV